MIRFLLHKTAWFRTILQFVNISCVVENSYLDIDGEEILHTRMMTEEPADSHTSPLSHRSQIEGSRITRLYSFQELVLEYSAVVIVLGCFFLISMSSRLLKQSNCYELC